MAEYNLRMAVLRPFFAELPYYAWGQVNYDSEGDCKNPRDRNWTWIELTHRGTCEQVEVSSSGSDWKVWGSEPPASRIASFLATRCDAEWIGLPPDIRDWDHEQANQRALRVAEVFENDLLIPFADGHMFWGSWKWIGWFGTSFTWVGR